MQRTTLFLIIATTFGLVSFGCGEPTPRSAAPSPVPVAPAPTAAEHAPSAVAPGSHEDWCGAHEVPESLCTRCNPSLIAAFRATGDWCEEHNLPESQCKICNPNLRIERPAASAGQ